jgi:hypothetical protein
MDRTERSRLGLWPFSHTEASVNRVDTATRHGRSGAARFAFY